jgi:hypothetical protein
VSVRHVTQAIITCDTCGDEAPVDEPTAMGARIAAYPLGWRYAEGRLPGTSGQKGQRQFDYCPTCWPGSYHAKRDARPTPATP